MCPSLPSTGGGGYRYSNVLVFFHVFIYILFVGIQIFQRGDIFEPVLLTIGVLPNQGHYFTANHCTLRLAKNGVERLSVVQHLEFFYLIHYDYIVTHVKYLE